MSSKTITITTEVELTPEAAAVWFANLDDEGQAGFLIAVAREAAKWDAHGVKQHYQWFLVGRHLRDCECSTREARQLVQSLNEGMEKDE